MNRDDRMGYLELTNAYIKVTEEIGKRLNQKSRDISNKKEIESLRERQKELAAKIDEYNGVRDER